VDQPRKLEAIPRRCSQRLISHFGHRTCLRENRAAGFGILRGRNADTQDDGSDPLSQA
jgi:hypothetical protein